MTEGDGGPGGRWFPYRLASHATSIHPLSRHMGPAYVDAWRRTFDRQNDRPITCIHSDRHDRRQPSLLRPAVRTNNIYINHILRHDRRRPSFRPTVRPITCNHILWHDRRRQSYRPTVRPITCNYILRHDRRQPSFRPTVRPTTCIH